MKVFRQVSLALILGLGWVCAEPTFDYKAPTVKESFFGNELGMLNRERDEYATNLASYAGNLILDEEVSPGSLMMARRTIALALHLAPRNKRALVLNFQLAKGVLPKRMDSQYSAESLAHLLLTRAEVLFQQKGEANELLSKYFIEMAATLDPRNEDAVYAFQLQEINYGSVPWKKLTDG